MHMNPCQITYCQLRHHDANTRCKVLKFLPLSCRIYFAYGSFRSFPASTDLSLSPISNAFALKWCEATSTCFRMRIQEYLSRRPSDIFGKAVQLKPPKLSAYNNNNVYITTSQFKRIISPPLL